MASSEGRRKWGCFPWLCRRWEEEQRCEQAVPGHPTCRMCSWEQTPSPAVSPLRENHRVAPAVPISAERLWQDGILFSVSGRQVYEMETRETGFTGEEGSKCCLLIIKPLFFRAAFPQEHASLGPGRKGHHHFIHLLISIKRCRLHQRPS